MLQNTTLFSKHVRFTQYDPVSILYKSIAGRYWPVRVADGPITTRYRFIKNASSENESEPGRIISCKNV